MSHAFTSHELRIMNDAQRGAILDALVGAIRADGRIEPSELEYLRRTVSTGPWAEAGMTVAAIQARLERALERTAAIRDANGVLALGRECAAAVTDPSHRDKMLFAMLMVFSADGMITRQESGFLSVFAQGLGVGANALDRAFEAAADANIHQAVARGKLAAVRELLDRGTPIDARDANAWTPLHIAVATGQTEIVALLLERGADVHARHNKASTPLMLACNKPYAHLVTALLAKGARPDEVGAAGLTAMHLASMFGQVAVARALRAGGASVELRDESTRTPLHCAAAENRIEFVNYLIAERAVIDARTKLGCTPLHFAASGQAMSAAALLDAGAAIEATDVDGQTPLHYAARNWPEVVALLIARRARVDAATAKGVTPLQVAAREGYTDCVRQLLAAGADVTAKNIEGGTALFAAAVHDRKDVFDLLVSGGADPDAATSFGTTPRGSIGAAKSLKLRSTSRSNTIATASTTAVDPVTAIDEFHAKRRSGALLLRALVEHEPWHVLAAPIEAPGLAACVLQGPQGTRVLLAFSTEARCNAFVARAAWLPRTLRTVRLSGTDLFANIPASVEVLGVDQDLAQPERAIHYKPAETPALRRVAVTVALERALRNPVITAEIAARLTGFEDYQVGAWCSEAGGPSQVLISGTDARGRPEYVSAVASGTPTGDSRARYLVIANPDGRRWLPVFTSEEAAQAFRSATPLLWPETGAGLADAAIGSTTARVFRIADLPLDGVLVNPCGPGISRLLSLEECDRIARLLPR